MFRPTNLLVTGGAGFIGANFVRYCLDLYDDIRIINLDALTYAGSLSNLEGLTRLNHHHFVQGNICDRDLVAKLLREYQIDTIVHFAAESHVDRSISGPSAFIESNFVGTFCLVEEARHYWLEVQGWDDHRCRFHHISTDEVYGSLRAEDPAFSESTPYAPNSPYSASKAGADHLVRAYQHTYGLPTTTSNCSNNYGPYQHPEKFIPTVIRACMTQSTIPIYGDGRNVRDWLYVMDHCHGIDTVIRQGNVGETYNIGGNNEWSNSDVATTITTLFDKHTPKHAPHSRLINPVADRPGHDWRYAIDASKIKNELKWEASKDFLQGLKETITYFTKLRSQ